MYTGIDLYQGFKSPTLRKLNVFAVVAETFFIGLLQGLQTYR